MLVGIDRIRRCFVQSATILRLVLGLLALFFCCAPVSATGAELHAEILFRGLNTPWALDFAPDDRIFLSERSGRIRVVERGKLRPEPWLSIEVASVGEAGLMGIAVDPQFSQNRFVYAAYSYRSGFF